jgi:hypothetical protein
VKLSGRRILVLVAEHIVARSIRDVLETQGAVVMLGPYSGPPHFDAVIVDREWARRSMVKTLFDAAVPVIGYTSDAGSFQKRFAGATIICKPAADSHFVDAIDSLPNRANELGNNVIC